MHAENKVCIMAQPAVGHFAEMFEPAINHIDSNMEWIFWLCINGIFGPNDNFSDFAPMLPSIIKRADHAFKYKKNWRFEIDGKPLREYTYSYDMAKAMMWCYKNYSSEKIINVGSNEELSIEKIVEIISKNIGLNSSRITYDRSKPSGVMRKSMDNSKFIELSGF